MCGAEGGRIRAFRGRVFSIVAIPFCSLDRPLRLQAHVTAINVAARFGHSGAVRLLLRLGVDATVACNVR